MKYHVIQRQRTINGHRGPILEIELFADEPAARDRAGVLRDANPEHIVSVRRVGCMIPDTREVKLGEYQTDDVVIISSSFSRGPASDDANIEDRHGRGRA